jgi:excisionase family DNA binding protein
MERIYNLDEAAAFLKCTRRRVNDLCKRGELPFKPDGRYNKLFKESDLQAFLNKGYGFHRRPIKKRPTDPSKTSAGLTKCL